MDGRRLVGRAAQATVTPEAVSDGEDVDVTSAYCADHGIEKVGLVMLDLGYAVLAIRDVHGNRAMPGKPVELVPAGDIHLAGPPHGFNMLAVKDHALLQRPELRIVPGVSPKLLPEGEPGLHHPVGGF